MAKEYVVAKAFRKTKSKTDKTPQEFESHGKKMWPWMVQVEGENFWFTKNTLENGQITPGDTMYGLFDEEEVTNRTTGETFTVKKFVRMQRPDGSYDKVQARSGQGAQSEANGSQGASGELLERIKALEEAVFGKKEADPLPSDDDDHNRPIDLSDIPF